MLRVVEPCLIAYHLRRNSGKRACDGGGDIRCYARRLWRASIRCWRSLWRGKSQCWFDGLEGEINHALVIQPGENCGGRLLLAPRSALYLHRLPIFNGNAHLFPEWV